MNRSTDEKIFYGIAHTIVGAAKSDICRPIQLEIQVKVDVQP